MIRNINKNLHTWEEILKGALCFWESKGIILKGGKMETRICTECKNKVSSCFIINDGDEYYCSEECLHKHYTEKQYIKMYENYLAYWTEF